MRICCVVTLAVLMGLFAVAISLSQERSLTDVRHEVEELCQCGEIVSAFHVAMKSWQEAQRKYGNGHPRTAECMVTVADVAIHREKYYLAGQLYRKALSIEEPALGSSHPDVVHCKRILTVLQKNNGQYSAHSGD
ncbi:MAG: tetratricopeptide repeat protein [Desulfomonilaceae bacterium]